MDGVAIYQVGGRQAWTLLYTWQNIPPNTFRWRSTGNSWQIAC
jgi:hypothetical protein